MKIFAFLLHLWQVLSPYLNGANLAAIQAAIDKALTDYQGGNYIAVVNDLLDAIALILPEAGAELQSLKIAQNTMAKGD